MSYLMFALLNGTPAYLCSNHSGENVLNKMEQFKPNMVVAFPQTFVEMTECNLSQYNLETVHYWFNGGDALHEQHIRRLIAHGSWKTEKGWQRGSVLVDGLGSSEMGFSLFRHVHTPQSNKYDRCIGRPHEWVEAQILSPEGNLLPCNVVGELAVKSPSVTVGYWNDSVLSCQMQRNGYWLTGDLAYRDADGFFYHVDRTPDRITTSRGIVYSLQTEEALLAAFNEIADCSVAGRRSVSPDVLAACVWVRFRPGSKLAQMRHHDLLPLFNEALRRRDLTPMNEVRVVNPQGIPLGATGKVLKRVLRQQEANLC